MIIANPLYDVVFKSLMEDKKIAQGIISELIGQEVIDLQPKPQETAISIEVEHNVTIYRLDYVALIKNSAGAHQKVLIEVQKAKLHSEIQRFRKYLGKQYLKPETITAADGNPSEINPHIIAIYILGFSLGDKIPAYAKVDRKYMNILTGKHFDADCHFIEALSHDTYVLQTTKVGHDARNELERLLAVFSQSDFADKEKHTITFPDAMTRKKNKLLGIILRHLSKLSTSPEIREKMEAEDDAYLEFQAAVDGRNQELKQEIKEALQREEEERRQKEEERRQKEEERRQKEEALTKINKAIKELVKSGMSEEQARKLLDI